MVTSAWISRICFAITTGIGTATALGAIPPRYAVWCVIATAMIQAFQHPVQQSTNDNRVASSAVAVNQSFSEKN